MATDNPTNDPKTATADEAAIQDLPESKVSTALTPDEETNVRGGAANVVNSSRSNIKTNVTTGSNSAGSSFSSSGDIPTES